MNVLYLFPIVFGLWMFIEWLDEKLNGPVITHNEEEQ